VPLPVTGPRSSRWFPLRVSSLRVYRRSGRSPLPRRVSRIAYVGQTGHRSAELEKPAIASIGPSRSEAILPLSAGGAACAAAGPVDMSSHAATAAAAARNAISRFDIGMLPIGNPICGAGVNKKG
jgi:hypothetical protein